MQIALYSRERDLQSLSKCGKTFAVSRETAKKYGKLRIYFLFELVFLALRTAIFTIRSKSVLP
jgi:hypothetical protein